MNLLLTLNLCLNFFSVAAICNKFKNLSIFFIVYLALIILNSEILSILNSLDEKNILILSFIEGLFGILYFLKCYKNKEKLYFPNIKEEFDKIKNALKLDKYLIAFLVVLLFVLIISGIMAFCMPVLEPDARIYHFVRVFHFVKQHNFSHFLTNDIRTMVMPFNSEIIYTYFYLFKKNDFGFGFLSYFSYISLIFSMYLLFRQLKMSIRKVLFSILTFSSLGLVVVQIASLQTDIIIAALTMNAIYLFFKGVDENKISNIYFASLAYAIAIGTKTTAVINFPVVFLVLVFYLFLYQKKNKLKNVMLFLGFLGLNFLIFSSYKYILNYISYNHIIAPEYFRENCDNKKNAIAVLVNMILLMKKFLGIEYTKEFDERTTGAVVLGLYFFVPSLIYSFKYFFKKSKMGKFMAFLALTFFINWFIISYALKFFPYTIRFFVPYCALSAMALSVFYKKVKYKNLVVLTCLICMTFSCIFSQRIPIYKYISLNLKDHKEYVMKNQKFEKLRFELAILRYYKNNFSKEDKIALLDHEFFYELKQLMTEGYNIDVLDFENFQKGDLSSYKKILMFEAIANDGSKIDGNDYLACIIEKDTEVPLCLLSYDFLENKNLEVEYMLEYKKDLKLIQLKQIGSK